MLNQLRADERSNIGMVEDVIECIVEVDLRRYIGRRNISVEQLLGAKIVLSRVRNHRPVPSSVVFFPFHRRAGLGSIGPTCINTSKFSYSELGVGWDRDAAAIYLNATIGVEHRSADGE